MALSKVTYINGTTVIGAENLNAIQDEIIANGENITAINGTITTVNGTIAPVEASTTASAKHEIGEHFYLNNVLYEATALIPVGGTITVGTNCKLAVLTEQVEEQSDRIEELEDTLDSGLDNLVVRTSEQLLADTGTLDKEPYTLSAVPYDVTRVSVKSLVGGTIVWNQILPNGNFASTDTWETGNCTISANNNVLTLTASSGSVVPSIIKDTNAAFAVAANHKYLVMVDVKISDLKSKFPAVQVFGLYINKTDAVANSWITISGIKNSGSDTSARPAVYPWNTAAVSFTGEETCEIRNFCLFDLTQMFGSTIANYIYTMETTIAGAGVAFFKSLFPKSYYAYNSGELMSVNTSAHVMRDADENVIGNYPLDSSLTLRGIPKLGADDKIYYDGDTYESNGTVTRKYGILNLGDVGSWVAESSTQFYASTQANPSTIGKMLFHGNIVSTKWKCRLDGSYNNLNNGDISVTNNSNSQILRIKDSAYTSYTAEQFKTAMSGVYIVYELKTETTEEADPYQELQICSPYGTEEYVDAGASASTPTRDVAIPVGHESFYHEDLKGKIEGLPKDLSMIAPVLAEFVADTALVANDFRLIQNELYRITGSIASGATITPGTNATKTTVAEVLKALLNV